MRLRKAPVRPVWKPFYDASTVRIEKLVAVRQRGLLERPDRGSVLV